MRPLEDIRVLAVTAFLAGPYCGMNLARLGAEVIKVEIPGRGDPVRANGPFLGPDGTHETRRSETDISIGFLKRNQGVKSVTLDLKDERGRAMFMELAKSSDVLVENLSPGSMSRLGLGFPEVSGVNPGVIYCSISGYGQTGVYSDKPAHDPQIQAMSGLMDINGDPDRPPTRVGFYIGDLVTPLFACYAILAALREKERTGQGQHLDVSMIDALVSLMFMENIEDYVERGATPRTGNLSRTGPTGVYNTVDGDVSITAASDDQWRRLTAALGAPELREDPRFVDHRGRIANVDAARHEIQSRIGKLTRAEAMECLEASDVPCSPVRSAAEVLADEHFWRRGTLRPLRHAALDDADGGVATGFPVAFSGGPLPERDGAPTLGMHNQQVYRDLLDLGPEDLQQLEEEGVV